MTKLVISWGGDYRDTQKIDDIYKRMLMGKKILYIPRAMRKESYPWCLEWIQNVFPVDEGYSVYLLSEEEFIENKELHLETYSGIYMGWGNTYRLLKLIKNTGFSMLLKQFLQDNKPVYGWSAWAIIMGKEIHTAPDMNAVKLSFEETLWYDACAGYSIACHYKETQNNEIIDYVMNYHIPVICLPEATGIICQDDTYTIAGEKIAYMVDINGDIKELAIWSHI